MKIHPLQTGLVRAKKFQFEGARNNLSRIYQLIFTQKWSEWLPIYSWIIELSDQLILIDTGETSQIYNEGYLPKGGVYHKAVQTRITKEEEINFKIESLGFQCKDINTIVLTHLHGDHIGGIQHFPNAKFYVSKIEYEMAISKKGPGAGYFKKNWPSWFSPELITYSNTRVGSFSQSYQMKESEQVVLVPTPGHSLGHQSVIVKDTFTNYFIGGDVTYNIETLHSKIPCVILNNKAAKASVVKAQEYVTSESSIYLSSHDWNAPKLLTEN